MIAPEKIIPIAIGTVLGLWLWERFLKEPLT